MSRAYEDSVTTLVADAAANIREYAPVGRPRRLRSRPGIRSLVRETHLVPSKLVAPLFVTAQAGTYEPIATMPGQFRLGPDIAAEAAETLENLGVGGVMLFGIPDSKDPSGSAAADPNGAVPATLRAFKERGCDIVAIADVCLCEYISHGHCGVLRGEDVDPEATLELLSRSAVVYAQAGADFVAPSAMMDGQVRAVRMALDRSVHQRTGILGYGSKYASVLYGPFKDAARAGTAFGNRRSYQLDPANSREALREFDLDAIEGADILIVKPAVTSLDVLVRARERFDHPLAAFQTSGEVAMIETAAAQGWLDRRTAAIEFLTAIARAGADIIVTYLAADVAMWLADDHPA